MRSGDRRRRFGAVPNRGGRWDVLLKADGWASALLAAAIALASVSTFRTPPPHGPRGLIWVAPLANAGLFVALVAVLLWRDRHGFVRVVSALAAALFAVVGAFFVRGAPPSRVVIIYWIPALLAIGAALVLQRSKRLARAEAHRRRHP